MKLLHISPQSAFFWRCLLFKIIGKMKNLLLPILLLVFSIGAHAQIDTPAASPSASWSQDLGLTSVEMEFSRPSIKGRTIFAKDGLVPFGKLWRTGANLATKFTIGSDAMLGDQKIEAGSYAVLSIPTESEWTLMFYAYEGKYWSSYKEKEATATVTAKVHSSPMKMESFNIWTDNLTNNSLDLVFGWENTVVKVPVSVEIHETIMKSIKTVMAGPSTNDYYAAASYLYDADTDMETALEYVQKATNVDEPRFWMVRKEALILAKLNRKQEAIAAAKRSLELAKAADNADYVKMNEDSIKEWSGK